MTRANHFAKELSLLCRAEWYCIEPWDTFRDGGRSYLMVMVVDGIEYEILAIPDLYDKTFPSVDRVYKELVRLGINPQAEP